MPLYASLNNRRNNKINDQMIYTNEYNALNNAYNEKELDNNEAINESIDNNVLSKRSNDMTSEEFNNKISSEESISDTSIEELDYENLSETSDNSEIISDESNDCITNEEESDKIVDESLSREQILSINGEFAPYFNNITETLMFCWVEKHNISTNAYDELSNIFWARLTSRKNQELWHSDIWKELLWFEKHLFELMKQYNCKYFVIYKESSTRVGRILAIVKLYINLYYDDFGTFRNTYHLLGGVYIQIGNLSFDKRKQLRNQFLLWFVPFGGKFDKFIEPFVSEMKQLEKEKIMDIKGIESLVIASLGDVTADLLQGNDLVGVKRHGATRGCRTCNTTKDFWTSNNINLALISRYHYLTNIQFDKILAASTITRHKEIVAEYGLHIKLPILDKLKRERHSQLPHDIYHATAAKILRFLKITIDALSSEEKSAFIIFWKLFDYPKD
ncbi:hypothetical protein C2G38_2206155 [Gigaspora rosea]|uniref:Uncharacterized protein n=1 Tax=Gigaspora rosea TaxID=44941 RepID=A0A397UJH5_9GLOM|nr:hypothetical protein C2G38_2206155 [Gigaspora rosea]